MTKQETRLHSQLQICMVQLDLLQAEVSKTSFSDCQKEKINQYIKDIDLLLEDIERLTSQNHF